MSSPHGNLLGIFKLPKAYAVADLQWDVSTFDSAMDELTQAKVVDWNSAEEYVCIICSQDIAPPNNQHQLTHRIGLAAKLPLMKLNIEKPLTEMKRHAQKFSDPGKFENPINRVLERYRQAIDTLPPKEKEEIDNEIESERQKAITESDHTINASGGKKAKPWSAVMELKVEHFDSWWAKYPREMLSVSPKTAFSFITRKPYPSGTARSHCLMPSSDMQSSATR